MIFISSASRLRSAERLIACLQRKDAIEVADERGYNFPSATGQQLEDLLQDLARTVEEEEGEEQVEEEIILEWDERYGESLEDLIHWNDPERTLSFIRICEFLRFF